MERNKATFRAMRETLGITQQSLANELGVKQLSVKRWEIPHYPQQAPDRAWELLEDLMARRASEVAKAAEAAGESVSLPYWMSAQDFDDLAEDDEPGATWTEANATRRAIAQELRARRVKVTWHDAATGD